MRYTTAALIASTLLMLSISPIRANEMSVHLLGEGPQHNNLQTHMFDGVHLTELQRRQMRDLMQQTQQDAPVVSVQDLKAIHHLVTAKQFDENSVRTLIDKIGQRQMARQVEMAKVRNQMYHLLTPQQQAIVEQNYQQRMKKLQETAHMDLP